MQPTHGAATFPIVRRPRPFGLYRLLYRVASGGMAEVHRARIGPPGDERDVAIKRLLPVYNDDAEFVAMLVDEARITAHFDHPNIARVLAHGEVDGQFFLAMEYVDGVDLRGVLRRCHERGESLPLAAAGFVVESALRGLHHAHEACDAEGASLGLIHRDFSPSNLLIGYDGGVKLIDFGVAKARLNRTRTAAGFIKGKVKFMSPEQTLRKGLDRRSDVFAAGVVLYLATTGRLPFTGGDDQTIIQAVRNTPHRPPSAVDERLDAAFDTMIDRALAKAPEDRFVDAAAFADALAAWWRPRWPDFTTETLGAEVARLFARERREAEALYDEYEDVIGEDTPTGLRQAFTRVLGSGEESPETAELQVEVDDWLRAHRAADEVWTGGRPPPWAEADGAVREVPDTTAPPADATDEGTTDVG
ncbi:MAG: serine/threonine protein kinase [Myxococcales bacterium]|nr:serine/threonine protein kinase [Myxococcales bacterium]